MLRRKYLSSRSLVLLWDVISQLFLNDLFLTKSQLFTSDFYLTLALKYGRLLFSRINWYYHLTELKFANEKCSIKILWLHSWTLSLRMLFEELNLSLAWHIFVFMKILTNQRPVGVKGRRVEFKIALKFGSSSSSSHWSNNASNIMCFYHSICFLQHRTFLVAAVSFELPLGNSRCLYRPLFISG